MNKQQKIQQIHDIEDNLLIRLNPKKALANLHIAGGN